MTRYQEVILKDGPAPKAVPSRSTPTKMPAHTTTARSPRTTNGPLTGRKTTFRSPAKRKPKPSPRKRKPDSEYDNFDTDYEDDIDEEPSRKNRRTSSSSEEPFVRIVGIDLGMWGHGRGRAASDKDPATVTADLNWRDSSVNQFKSPSVVAFKKDNPNHSAFRRGTDVLVGLNVTADMVSCSFFKASLDQRPQPSKFDNPILKKPIAKSLVGFSSPEEDEQAAIAVLKQLYDEEIEKATGVQTDFDERDTRETNFIFVLTHPAACSKAGRDKLEEIAKAAGLGSRPNDKVKLLSEAQAAAMAAFISYQAIEKHEVWRTYFKKGEWITVLDIGSLTVDTTTEEVASNDPRVQLNEKLVPEGGRCGIVTLHLHLLECILNKFGIAASDLPPTLVARGTSFHDECERVLRTYNGDESGTESNLLIKLPDSVMHDDYDRDFHEITLRADEMKKVFEKYIQFLFKLLLNHWEKAESQGHKIKTTIVCGGGSLLPFLWKQISKFCKEHGVKAVRPTDPIAAVCRGAIISELSDGLIGERMLRAHFGIKLEVNAEVVMKWVQKRGDIVDTTAPKMLEKVAGHFSMSVDQILNQAQKFELKIFTYDRDDRDVKDPDDPGVEEIASIILDQSNLSTYLKDKLAKTLESLDAAGRKQANMDVEVLLGVDDSARLYFQAKSGGSSLGRQFLRYGFTKNCN